MLKCLEVFGFVYVRVFFFFNDAVRARVRSRSSVRFRSGLRNVLRVRVRVPCAECVSATRSPVRRTLPFTLPLPYLTLSPTLFFSKFVFDLIEFLTRTPSQHTSASYFVCAVCVCVCRVPCASPPCVRVGPYHF